MNRVAVEPRVLADDLLLMSTGNQSLKNFEYAYNLTHKHLEDMAEKVAPTKCITYSSRPANRKWLKLNKWRRLGTTVKVVADMRDLGAHLNAAGKKTQRSNLGEDNEDGENGNDEAWKDDGTVRQGSSDNSREVDPDGLVWM